MSVPQSMNEMARMADVPLSRISDTSHLGRSRSILRRLRRYRDIRAQPRFAASAYVAQQSALYHDPTSFAVAVATAVIVAPPELILQFTPVDSVTNGLDRPMSFPDITPPPVQPAGAT